MNFKFFICICIQVGPLPGVVGLIIMGLVWSIPCVLITSELSCAIPDNGGYSLWVSEAFGEMWGFQESYWSWISGVLDSALYPILAYKITIAPYLEEHEDFKWYYAYGAKFLLTTLWTIPQLFNLKLVGNAMMVLLGVIMCPFLVLIIFRYTHCFF